MLRSSLQLGLQLDVLLLYLRVQLESRLELFETVRGHHTALHLLIQKIERIRLARRTDRIRLSSGLVQVLHISCPVNDGALKSWHRVIIRGT